MSQSKFNSSTMSVNFPAGTSVTYPALNDTINDIIEVVDNGN